MMVYSSTEMLGTVSELSHRRISMVLGAEAKRQGVSAQVHLSCLPDNVKEAIKTVARLHRSYIKHDYRHEQRDEGVVLFLCNYLAELHQTAGGHPRRPVVFTVPMSRQELLPRGTYAEVSGAIREQIG